MHALSDQAFEEIDKLCEEIEELYGDIEYLWIKIFFLFGENRELHEKQRCSSYHPF